MNIWNMHTVDNYGEFLGLELARSLTVKPYPSWDISDFWSYLKMECGKGKTGLFAFGHKDPILNSGQTAGLAYIMLTDLQTWKTLKSFQKKYPRTVARTLDLVSLYRSDLPQWKKEISQGGVWPTGDDWVAASFSQAWSEHWKDDLQEKTSLPQFNSRSGGKSQSTEERKEQ